MKKRSKRTERDGNSWSFLPATWSRRCVFFPFPFAALARLYSNLYLRICETNSRKNFFGEVPALERSVESPLQRSKAAIAGLLCSSVSLEPLVAEREMFDEGRKWSSVCALLKVTELRGELCSLSRGS